MDTSLDPSFSQLQRISTPKHDSTPSIGTPIKLASSAAAFKRPGSEVKLDHKVHKGLSEQGTSNTPSKGVIGQVSEMIFGW
jgi:hypothetical protein